MKKKVISLLLVAAMTTGLLAGCGTKEAATDSANTETSGEVALRFIDVSTSPQRQEFFENVFAAFKEETGISVEYEGVPWDDAADKLTVLGAADDLPDVITMHDAWMGQFTQAGWVIPLTDYYNTELKPYMNVATVMGVDQQISLYGDVYRIPDGLMNAGIFYRKDWVEEIGYEIPTGADWTWDAYFDLQRALTDSSKNRYGGSFRGARGGFDVVQGMLKDYTDGRVYDEEGNCLFLTDEAVAMFEAFCAPYLEGCAPKDALNWGFTELVDNFSGGLTGTLYNNTDVVPVLLEKMENEQWGVLPVPTATDGNVYNSAGYSYAYAVTDDSDYPEEAKQLITFLSNAENNMEYCKIAGMVPIRNDVEDDPMFGVDGPYGGFLVQLDYENLAFGCGYGAFDYTDMHQDMMHTEIQKYLLGQQSAKDALFNVCTELETRMKKYLADNPDATVEAPIYPNN